MSAQLLGVSRYGKWLPPSHATLDPNCSLTYGLKCCVFPGISWLDRVHGRSFVSVQGTLLPRLTPWGMGADFAAGISMDLGAVMTDVSRGWTLAAGFVLDGTSGQAGVIGEFYNGGGNPVSFEIGFGLSTGTAIEAGNYSGSTWTIASAGVSPTTNIAYDMVGRHDLSRIRVYTNGRQVGDVAATGPFSDSNTVRLGRRHDGNAHVDGCIAYAMLWNRPLTDAEMSVRYVRPFVMFR